jgi:hypothetical protein
VLFRCSDWRSCFELRGPWFENQAGNLLNWPALIVVFSSPFIHHDRLLNQHLTTLPSRPRPPQKKQPIIIKDVPIGRLYRNSHEEWTNIAGRYESGGAGCESKGGRPRGGRAQSRLSHEYTSQCIRIFHGKTFVRINLPMVAMVTALRIGAGLDTTSQVLVSNTLVMPSVRNYKKLSKKLVGQLGRVNCYWSSPPQSFLVPSPTRLTIVCYCLRNRQIYTAYWVTYTTRTTQKTRSPQVTLFLRVYSLPWKTVCQAVA